MEPALGPNKFGVNLHRMLVSYCLKPVLGTSILPTVEGTCQVDANSNAQFTTHFSQNAGTFLFKNG